MQGLLLMAALLLGSGAALAADGPLTDAVDTPEAVRQQLRDYFFNAARFGDNEVLDEFIRAGYDLNSADDKGYTALILAAYNGHGETVERLLAAGADACAEDKRGNTALLGAIFKGELGIAKRLLAVLDGELEGKEWIAGNYSIADIALCPWINALGFYGAKDVVGYNDLKNVPAWIERFYARPAVEKGKNIPDRNG